MIDSRGFTLVEMAIVLVIMGILVGMGAGMITPLTTMTKARETRASIAADRESIISWAASNNQLPDTARFPNIANIASDPWAQPFVYLYDPTLVPPIPNKDSICGRRSTSLSVVTVSPPATIANVAFIILSSADDGLVQTSLNASALPLIAATLNGAASGPAIANGARGSATGVVTLDVNSSDIVSWVTLDELRSKVGCQGSPLKILNNELPYGSATTPAYNARITADGGVPNTAPDLYSWCVQTTTTGTAPAGLTFQKLNAAGNAVAIPNVNNLFQANCSSYPVASWPQAGQLVLSGTPSPPNSYFITINVRDSNNNQVSKPFVMTVNP